MKFFGTLAAAALIGLPGLAQAQNVVATTADSLVQFFIEEGADVEVTEDGGGDPKLRIDHYGADFTLYFYGCSENTNCDAIQFFSGYKTKGRVRLVKANEWNTENRFSRAYISDGGSARIEHDVYLGTSGMTADDFAVLVSKWTRAQSSFEEFIDW